MISVLLMERAIQDLGAGVKWLRAQGCTKVVLLGYSGGAALSAFYQAQAEKLTVQATPAGDPVPLVPGDLPPVDGLVFCAAHAGRSRLLLEWIDPSVTDESDAASRDPSLDMYDAANGVPYSAKFLSHYRAGQRKRRDKIEAWVWERLRTLRAMPGGATDQAFVVHRTFADPRFQDTTIDPSDRKPGGMWGNAKGVNYASNAIGRYTSFTAFLSQWASVSAGRWAGQRREDIGPGAVCRFHCRRSQLSLDAGFVADGTWQSRDVPFSERRGSLHQRTARIACGSGRRDRDVGQATLIFSVRHRGSARTRIRVHIAHENKERSICRSIATWASALGSGVRPHPANRNDGY